MRRAETLCQTHNQRWLLWTLMIFLGYSTGGDAVMSCNQTYVIVTFPEDPPPTASKVVLDNVSKFCPGPASTTYSLVSNDPNFTIDMSSGIITCQSPDADARSSTSPTVFLNPWTLYVNVSDPSGNFTVLTVIVHITSINDNKATISNLQPTQVDWKEDTPPGTKVAGCSLTDNDYPGSGHDIPLVEITNGNTDNTFVINPQTCDIILVKKLNYSTTTSYNLTLQPYNSAGGTNETSSTLKLNVLKIPRAPTCAHYDITIGLAESNATTNRLVATLDCMDDDGAKNLMYTRLSPSSIPELIVDASGQIMLTQTLKWDKNTVNNKKQITVQVSNTGSSSSPSAVVVVYVVIQDVDDHVPVMSQPLYNGTISATTVIGSSILQVSATDEDAPGTDNSRIIFGLVNCLPDILAIDNRLGVIYLAGSIPPSNPSDVNCTVTAHSVNLANTTTSMVTVRITPQNHPPVFSQIVYPANVTEGAGNGAILVSVNATDPDGGDILTYFFQPITGYWPFSIRNNVSGEVVVSSLVDYEKYQHFSAPIYVRDNGSPPATATAYLVVTINPKNDFSPVFNSLGAVSLNRLSKPGSPVTIVGATDQDLGPDGALVYSLPNSSLPFVINSLTGEVRVGLGLDQYPGSVYYLPVTVTDQSKTDPKSATITVTINLTTTLSNDHDPVCDPLGPLKVTPNFPGTGNVVGYIPCTDADANTLLDYQKQGGDPYNLFTLIASNGTLRLSTTPLTANVAGVYNLVVRVTDNGNPQRSTITSIQINVEANLQFANLPNTTSIYENANLSSTVYNVSAIGAYSLITYSIVQGNDQGAFSLDSTSGQLRVIKSLDRELNESYTLSISASSDGQTIIKTLGINILDINDNPPKFTNSFESIRVFENATVSSVLKTFSASDPDTNQNAVLTFYIVSGDRSTFKMDQAGAFSLTKKLNFATQSFYTLVLGVMDGGSPPLNSTMILYVEVVAKVDTMLVITPSGGTTNLTLSEDVAVGSPVFHIDVQNLSPGTNVTFNISSGNSAGCFYLDSSGVLYVSSSLDRETTDLFRLRLLVTSSNGISNTTQMNVIVTDVNDCDPMYNPANYVFTVENNTPANSNIGTLSVTDADLGVNKDLTLLVLSINPPANFDMTGKTLITRLNLNSNVQSQYNIAILAQDHGSPSRNSTAYVTVLVKPQYKSPYFLVPKIATIDWTESLVPGSLLYDFDARANGATEPSPNIDGDLLYSLVSGNSSLFFVEPNFGILQLRGVFNYTNTKTYTLVITAFNKHDLSLSDNFTLVINIIQVNLHDPEFTAEIYTWSVNETATPGTVIGRVSATDLDQGAFGNVTYSLETNNKFDMNALTGYVTLRSALEFSVAQSYHLRATATDQAGVNSRMTIVLIIINVIDFNNHYPVFLQDSFQVAVPENLAVNTVILTVVATDLDSGSYGTVNYSITSGNTNGLFSLDSSTGALSIKSSLDFETGRQHVLNVKAQDGGNPALSNNTVVTINVQDVNDNKPSFNTARIDVSIRSDAAPLTLVTQVSATDKDTGDNAVIDYVIQNNNGFFSIESSTGIIRTASSLALAGSFQPLTVLGIDRGRPQLTGSVIVVVTIQPVQSPGPAKYSFDVPENQAAGTLVGTIARDVSLNNITGYSITGGNNGNAFQIITSSTKTGQLTTGVSLDREMCAYYQLVISVSYSTGSLDFLVNVKVIDVNDNAPVFDKSVLNIPLVENLPKGTIIGKLTVSDADESGNVNSQLDLSISPSTAPFTTYFTVDSSGAISLANQISYEILSSLTFYVLARDRGSPQLSSFATINVNVIDVDEKIDYKPLLAAFFVTCVFPDDAVKGDAVCQVTLSNVGVSSSQTGDVTTFTIVGRDSVFDIHPTSGLMTVLKPSFISPDTRYFQWVTVTLTTSTNVTSYVLMVRLDTFNKDRDLISVKVNTDLVTLQSQKSEMAQKLQALYSKTARLVRVWDVRSTDPSFSRRKLLASTSEALVVVEADNSTNDISNVGRAKTFLTSEEAVKTLQQSSLGSAPLAVTSVQQYSPSPSDDLDPAYIALIVVGSLVALALIIFFITIIIYCCLKRRQGTTDKKHLVEKKKQSKQLFGNLHRSAKNADKKRKPHKQTESRSPPNSKPATQIHPLVDADDPLSDGMPVRPTTAVFLSSSTAPAHTAPAHTAPADHPRHFKNSSTVLESLEERPEEDVADGTSLA